MSARRRTLVVISSAALGVSLLLTSSLFGQQAPKAAPAPAAAPRRAVAARRVVMLLALDFSHDGSLVVTGGDALYVHEVATGKLLQEFRVPKIIDSIACSPASHDLFAAGGDDGIIRLYRLGAEHPERELKGQREMVQDLDFSPDGARLVSSGAMYAQGRPAVGEVRMWDVESGQLLHSLDFKDTGVSCIAFSHDGQHVALTRRPAPGDPRQTSVAELYEVRDWRLLRSVPFEPGFGLALDFTPDDSQLLIAGGICVPKRPGGCQPTGKLWVVDLNDDGLARQIAVDQSDYFRSASLTPVGDLFATGTSVIGARPNGVALTSMIQMRQLDTGEIVWSRDGGRGDPYGVTVSPDGELVAGCNDGQVWIFKASTGELVSTIKINLAR